MATVSNRRASSDPAFGSSESVTNSGVAASESRTKSALAASESPTKSALAASESRTKSALAASIARMLVHALGALLSPNACAGCDARTSHVFCACCAATLVRVDGAADRGAAHAFAEYGGAVAEAIRRFKYAGRPELARPLGSLMRLAARDALLSVDLVVPVPLHPKRLAERGYNQAALLGRSVARELGVPLAARALARSRDTPRQATLDAQTRRHNVEGAFRVTDAAAIRGKRILVVDDVATTGATLRACRAALAAVAARSVDALVLAVTT